MEEARQSLIRNKAYDATWHEGLIYKLKEFKFPISLIKMISSYLQERTFQVKEEGAKSTSRK